MALWPPWDFSRKEGSVAPPEPAKTCRRGHQKLPGRLRCHLCDREREQAAWTRLQANPKALAAHNAAQAARKRTRKRRQEEP